MSTEMRLNPMEKFKQMGEETKETKTFFQDTLRVNYQNSSKIFNSQEPDCSDFKVNNYLCRQQGRELYKITEIIYQDRIIRIQDRLQVFIDSPKMDQSDCSSQEKNEVNKKNCSRTIQKVRIFNKNASKGTKAQKKDKKNIVKNIVKLFFSWLEKKQNDRLESHYEASLRELKKMMGTENFNNRLIQKIIGSRDVNKVFLQFVEDGAQENIKYSRIQDKQSYYEALQIYKNLLTKAQSSMGGPTISSSEASQQSHSPQEFNISPQVQENSSSSHNSDGSGSKGREAGIRQKSRGENKNNIIVIQNQMSD